MTLSGGSIRSRRSARPSRYMREWFAPQAARELLAFRELVDDYEHHDVLRVILARAARSARRTTHFDLDFPRAPQVEPYWCHKHKRECRPVESARAVSPPVHARHARADQGVREAARERRARRPSLHGDSRDARLRPLVRRHRHVAAVSGPDRLPRATPHAYELLGLDDLRDLELGAAAAGTSRAAIAAYCDGISTSSAARANRCGPARPC